MRSLYAFGLAMLAAALLVFCGDGDGDGEEPVTSSTKYSLKLSGISKAVQIGKDINISAEIMQGDKLVSEGDIATSKVSLLIECGDDKEKVAEEKDVAAKAGKVTFKTIKTIKVGGEDFKGDCKLTLTSTIAGEEVKLEHEFKTTTTTVAILPSQSTGKMPTALTVGQPFVIPSAVALKVQPNDMCERKLVLAHYDAKQDKVQELLTDGITIQPVDGLISGLVLMHAQKSGEAAPTTLSCAAKTTKVAGATPPQPSISLSVSPGFAKGFRADVVLAKDAPATTATLHRPGGGNTNMCALDESRDDCLKLLINQSANFGNVSHVYFNNKSEGNDWTRVTTDLGDDFNRRNHAVGRGKNEILYVLPVKAIVKAELPDDTTHWLYFYKNK